MTTREFFRVAPRVYGCADAYTACKRTVIDSIFNKRTIRVTKPTEAIVVLATSMGTIALRMGDLVVARSTANELVPLSGPSHSRSAETSPVQLVDANQIALQFSVDAEWFRARAREGRIPHVRIGKYVRFDPVEIRDFFRQNPDRHANS